MQAHISLSHVCIIYSAVVGFAPMAGSGKRIVLLYVMASTLTDFVAI